MSPFRPIDRKTGYLLPPSVEEWLPEDHLARFIVEAVEGLNLSRMEQVVPMLEQLAALPDSLGQVGRLLADTGYCSAQNVAACEAAGVEPLIAVARDEHHAGWRERFTEPDPLPADATPMAGMAHRLKTKAGRAAYALRKQTVEPVFGIIKSVLGFRQFLLRGLDQVTGEWRLVCLAWNLKRMAALRP